MRRKKHSGPRIISSGRPDVSHTLRSERCCSRQSAHELERREIAEMPGLAEGPSAAASRPERDIHDRILIYVTADPSTAMLVRRGRRMADYLGAECFAICVLSRQDGRRSASNMEGAEKHLNFARNLHIETRILEGDDCAETLVDFARHNQVTQILVGRPKKCCLLGRLLGTDLVLRVVRKAN